MLYKEKKPKGANDEETSRTKTVNTHRGRCALVKPSIVEDIHPMPTMVHFNKKNSRDRFRRSLNEDGYIVTNAHVLKADGYHTVHTVDGKILDAKIIGRDSKTDIAVIKVNYSGLTPAILGNSR